MNRIDSPAVVQCLLLFVFAFSAAFALSPLVRWLGFGFRLVDRVGERKIHETPIPLLGGVVVALSGGLTVLTVLGLDHLIEIGIPLNFGRWWPILAGGVLVFVGGLFDDIRPLPAWAKFLFQAAGVVTAIWLGIRIDQVSIFGTEVLHLGVLAVPLTFLWIIGLTNAFNLVDGLDGLAVGLGSIAAGTCAALFLLRGELQDAMLLIILLGALIGFLPYNFNPARLYLGDSGSQLIGYLLAVTAIAGSQKRATALAVVIPLLIFGLPILDTLLSMVRRLLGSLRKSEPNKTSLKGCVLAAKRMFEGDQEHIHHRLIALGFSHRNAVLVLYAIALGLSLLALLSVLSQYRNAAIILVTVGLAICIGIGKLGYKEVGLFRIRTLLRWYNEMVFSRLFFLGFVDLILIAAAYWAAYLLKYDTHSTMELNTWHLNLFPIILLVQFVVFYAFGLYRGVWRALGVGDLLRVGLAVCGGVVLSYSIVLIGEPPVGTGRFFAIDLLVLGLFTGGARSAYRVLDYSQQRGKQAAELALIYGAGRGGELVLRELLQNSMLGLQPIGFIDDDPTFRNRTVNSVSVLGSGQDLASILDSQAVSTLIVSSNKICGERLKQAIRLCKERGIPIVRAQLQFQPLVSAHAFETNSAYAAFQDHFQIERVLRTRRVSMSPLPLEKRVD